MPSAVGGIGPPQDRSRPAGPVWAHVPHRVGRLLMPLPRRAWVFRATRSARSWSRKLVGIDINTDGTLCHRVIYVLEQYRVYPSVKWKCSKIDYQYGMSYTTQFIVSIIQRGQASQYTIIEAWTPLTTHRTMVIEMGGVWWRSP